MKSKLDIGYSSLSERIYIWKSKEEKPWLMKWVWEKIDITNKFLSIVEQYFPIESSRVIKQGEAESLFIHIENTEEWKEKVIAFLKKSLPPELSEDNK